MSNLMYWILFCLLVSLLVIFLSCLIFNIILDNCLTHPEECSGKEYQVDKDETDDEGGLNKYRFDKHDVEDLTRIQGDFKTVLPKVALINEVNNTNVERLLKRKDTSKPYDALNSSLSDIHEEDGSKHHSVDDLNSTGTHSILHEENGRTSFKKKKEISQSVDDLEFCDPRGIDVLKEIHAIKEKTLSVEEELDYFVGGPNDVKFYEINEKFLRLMIALCDVKCENDELRKKKSETMEYIEGCQRKLKAKARNAL